VKPEVLYLSYDGLTDPLGQSQVLPYLVLLSDNYAITLVSFEKKNRYAEYRHTIEQLIFGKDISWIPKVYTKNPPVISTLFDLIKLKRVCVSEFKRKNFRIVHCRSYITSLVGLWLQEKYKVSFIFDMRGFFPDERVEVGLWDLGNLLYRRIYKFFKNKEKQFLIKADHVVVLTHEAKAILVSQGTSEEKITVIPCCVDLSEFSGKKISEDSKMRLRENLGIGPSDLVLLYLGSIGTWYMWREMLHFFNNLKRSYPGAKFLVLTPDVGSVGPHKDIITLSAKREDIPAYISISNASVCFIKPSFYKKGSSATKMAEVLAMQVPVFVNPGWGDVQSLSMQIPGIHIVDPESDKKVFLPVERPIQTDEFKDIFSTVSGVNKYKRIYQRVTNQGNLNYS
jgi:glycosyltransferase involved in cell wall biosynthesis